MGRPAKFTDSSTRIRTAKINLNVSGENGVDIQQEDFPKLSAILRQILHQAGYQLLTLEVSPVIQTKLSCEASNKSSRLMLILEFINQYQYAHGISPSVREIGEHIGVPAKSLVRYYLNILERTGYIRRTKSVARSIVVLANPDMVEQS